MCILHGMSEPEDVTLKHAKIQFLNFVILKLFLCMCLCVGGETGTPIE